jgi:SPP1 family predicted phage head-tail adaptor
VPADRRDLGAMRKLVRIEKKTQLQDSTGEPKFSWELVGSPRAEKLQAPGRELWSAAERSGRVPTVFRIHHPRADYAVKPQMRLTCDGVLYDIVSAYDPDGMKVDLLITCDELVNEPV